MHGFTDPTTSRSNASYGYGPNGIDLFALCGHRPVPERRIALGGQPYLQSTNTSGSLQCPYDMQKAPPRRSSEDLIIALQSLSSPIAMGLVDGSATRRSRPRGGDAAPPIRPLFVRSTCVHPLRATSPDIPASCDRTSRAIHFAPSIRRPPANAAPSRPPRERQLSVICDTTGAALGSGILLDTAGFLGLRCDRRVPAIAGGDTT